MQHLQYSYHVESLPRSVVKQTFRLNQLGMGGWRLVSVDGGKAYFIHSDPASGAGVRPPMMAEDRTITELEPARRLLKEGRSETA